MSYIMYIYMDIKYKTMDFNEMAEITTGTNTISSYIFSDFDTQDLIPRSTNDLLRLNILPYLYFQNYSLFCSVFYDEVGGAESGLV